MPEQSLVDAAAIEERIDDQLERVLNTREGGGRVAPCFGRAVSHTAQAERDDDQRRQHAGGDVAQFFNEPRRERGLRRFDPQHLRHRRGVGGRGGSALRASMFIGQVSMKEGAEPPRRLRMHQTSTRLIDSVFR